MKRQLGYGLLVGEVGKRTQASLRINRRHSVVLEVTDADGLGFITGTPPGNPHGRVDFYCNLEKGTGEALEF